MYQKALSMGEAREKLRHLEQYLQDDPKGLLSTFGRVLADRLHDRLIPIGFLTTCERAIDDLSEGTNVTNEPNISSLVRSTPSIYLIIRESIPQIAEVIFPSDFATEVRLVIELEGGGVL